MQLPDRQGRTPAHEAEAAGHADVLAMMARHQEVQAELAAQATAAAAQGGLDREQAAGGGAVPCSAAQ